MPVSLIRSSLISQLLPKGKGDFRTIYNLSQAARLPKAWAQQAHGQSGALSEPVNAALAPLLPLLSSLRRRLPAAFGTSVLGMTEVHVRWRHFVAERRHLAPSAPLHFSATDLTGCFDTIAQPRLFQVGLDGRRVPLTSMDPRVPPTDWRPLR